MMLVPRVSSRPTATKRLSVGILFGVLACALAGCATTPAASKPAASKPAAPKNKDPFESANRDIYRFNDTLDRHVLRPVAVAYHEHTPAWVQTGVHNFYENLGYPATVINQFLQGKFKEGSQDLARFALNTTLGWAGFIDVASGAKLPMHDEDSGQTLGRWGVPPGPYLMLPLLGPSTLRDAPARIADTVLQPLYWFHLGNERWGSLAVSIVDTRTQLLSVDRALREAYDPYVFMRDAYLQRRQYQVYDGNPPADATEDENWAEEALKEDEAGAAEEPSAPATSPGTPPATPTMPGPAPSPAQPEKPPATDSGTTTPESH
jgi:phospholipid-binding lipoprotein MlaA